MLWQQLHRCLSSSLLPRIFLGKPGLLLSMDDGGDGSCVAMASVHTSHLETKARRQLGDNSIETHCRPWGVTFLTCVLQSRWFLRGCGGVPQASWKAHALCLHFHSAFMAPGAPPATITTTMLSSLPNKPASALPTEHRRRRAAHPLFPPVPPFAFLVAVAKLSASFSQKWYPARRHAPSETLSSLACSWAFYRLEMLLQRLLQPAEFLLTCVLV